MNRIDEYLRHELCDLSAKEAAEIICGEFHQGKVKFTYSLTGRKSCPVQIVKQKDSAVIAADEVSPIEFLGGPPHKLGLYKGSLLTWLCDLILYDWITKGNYAELVGSHD